MKHIWGKLEILVSVFYMFTFVLVLMPYYDGLYRVLVNFSHFVLLWLSLFIIGFTLIHLCMRRASLGRVLLTLSLGLLVLFAGSQVHRWRYAITNVYITSHYCEGDDVKPQILGGITEIRVDGVERTGAFENSSHCLFVVCSEEFYYCDDAAVIIGP